jgi:two-component system sensor histidine kinase SenX3
VVLFAPDGQVVYSNPAARSLLGRRFDAATELTPGVLRDAVDEVRGALTGEGAGVEREFETAEAVVEASVVPAGPPGSVLVVARDVTRARRVERLRHDFVSNASHELKTPVASILALAQTLTRAAADDPEAVHRFIGKLESEAERLSRIVRDLLELSRLEGQPKEVGLVRLDQVVRTETERLRGRAEGAGLRLVLDPLPEVSVEGTDSDLALMVHNLLDNAMRYTPAGGMVGISLGVQAGSAILTVEDTGIGIPSRDLDRVFERFYRVDPARSRETGGTGLGLSIVRNVIDAHGGHVSVRSVLGAGSTFTVRLPGARVSSTAN